jgi:hypothetical protein
VTAITLDGLRNSVVGWLGERQLQGNRGSFGCALRMAILDRGRTVVSHPCARNRAQRWGTEFRWRVGLVKGNCKNNRGSFDFALRMTILDRGRTVVSHPCARNKAQRWGTEFLWWVGLVKGNCKGNRGSFDSAQDDDSQLERSSWCPRVLRNSVRNVGLEGEDVSGITGCLDLPGRDSR